MLMLHMLHMPSSSRREACGLGRPPIDLRHKRRSLCHLRGGAQGKALAACPGCLEAGAATCLALLPHEQARQPEVEAEDGGVEVRHNVGDEGDGDKGARLPQTWGTYGRRAMLSEASLHAYYTPRQDAQADPLLGCCVQSNGPGGGTGSARQREDSGSILCHLGRRPACISPNWIHARRPMADRKETRPETKVRCVVRYGSSNSRTADAQLHADVRVG